METWKADSCTRLLYSRIIHSSAQERERRTMIMDVTTNRAANANAAMATILSARLRRDGMRTLPPSYFFLKFRKREIVCRILFFHLRLFPDGHLSPFFCV